MAQIPTKWPPFPRSIVTPMGTLRVALVATVDRATPEPVGATTMGMYFPARRAIQVQKDLPPELMWATLFHEQMHAALYETGAANIFDDHQLEVICDVVGLLRTLELARK